MNFIENVKEKNQFPIIFIGSGITKRYFDNAPKWEELLLELWEKIYEREKFYEYYHKLESEGKNEFKIHLIIASKLEKDISDAFYSGTVSIENLTIEAAHKHHISPFRTEISNIFKNLKPKKGVEDEIKAFAQMLIKARFIVTTNYDNFIEECIQSMGSSIKVNIGNTGLFLRTEDYGELFKIHGSIDQVNSICITEKDYEKNESKLALVNAKILSNLTESPILFLGYSLTDLNIRELLSSYSENLPFEISEAVLRIGVVEWSEGTQEVLQIDSHQADLGMYYTKICTDNYLKIYQEISEIDQGMLPSEIAKVGRFFKNIIEVKGESGELQNVLASHVDIENLNSDDLKSKNFVVAFGDQRTIFKPVYYLDYLNLYFKVYDDRANFEGVLNYVLNQSVTTQIPFLRYANKALTNPELPKEHQSKLQRRIERYNLEDIIRTAHNLVGNNNIQIIEGKNCRNPQEVIEIETTSVKDRVKIMYIISKIKSFDISDVKSLIIQMLSTRSEITLKRSEYRKLFLAYSLLEE